MPSEANSSGSSRRSRFGPNASTAALNRTRWRDHRPGRHLAERSRLKGIFKPARKSRISTAGSVLENSPGPSLIVINLPLLLHIGLLGHAHQALPLAGGLLTAQLRHAYGLRAVRLRTRHAPTAGPGQGAEQASDFERSVVDLQLDNGRLPLLCRLLRQLGFFQRQLLRLGFLHLFVRLVRHILRRGIL